ncbi:hypothetical protein K456DRAFT_43783 [Colletotrichum gloeosporioides 23]|nr:hypothetical protein K456DRAFT_43783 [Colletotrichum gloeosporioides 23]
MVKHTSWESGRPIKQGLTFTAGDWQRFRDKVLSDCQIRLVGEPAHEQETWTSREEPVHIIDFMKFTIAKPAIAQELRKLSQAMSLSPGSSREVTPLTPCEDGDGAQTAEYWDTDLVGPYRDLENLASTDLVVKKVLTNLREDLETIKTKWDTRVVPVKDKSQRPGLMVEAFREWCAIRPRADAELSPALLTWLELSYASEEHSTWALLRASTSFKYWHKKPKLVWRMAGIQLQFIKSMTRPGQVPVSVVPNMYAALKPDGKSIRQDVSRMTEGMEPVVGVGDDTDPTRTHASTTAIMSGTGTDEELTRLFRLLQEAQELAAGEKQRADDAEQQNQPTSLDEYIAASHSLVYTKLTVETDRKLTYKGSVTNPRDKWCPTKLQPWSDFLEQQRVVFGTLCGTFPADRHCFESRSFLSGLGSRISKREITDEKALEYFLHSSVEDPVRAIMDEFKKVEEVRSAFGLGNGIVFDNHPHALSDTSEEVVNTPQRHPLLHRTIAKSTSNSYEPIKYASTDPKTPTSEAYLAFSLVALGMPGERSPHGQDERREAMDKLKTWAEDFETTLRSVPDDERQPPQSSPGYGPKAYKDVDRSPRLRQRRRRGHARDVHTREQGRKGRDESSDDESGPGMPDTPTPSERRTREMDTQSQGTRRSQRNLTHLSRGYGDGRNDNRHAPYCTQKCLSGLVRGRVLDPGCPNRLLHRKRPNRARRHDRSNGGANARHPIDWSHFVKLLRDQPERTLDDGVTPLGQGGARGVLFK